MSKKYRGKKQSTLQRATPAFPQGGALMYLSPAQLSSLYGQTFYGTQTKNIPAGSTALFPAGMPLPPQPNVNPAGLPVQFRFPVSYNTFPVDRSLQKPDIPSFQQLRELAKLDWGIGLCERKLLRMIQSLELKITLTKRAVAGGAEEKNYQKEITAFQDWFSKPDPQHDIDIHAWMQQAVVEQTQIDELYVYKNRTRGGKLLGLWIIDGSQIKPLLDDWGHPPQDYAYQQYPWGIPGCKYSLDQMIHRRETPATDTPYGRSCVERVIGITNLALRKLRQDTSHYTEGNIPAGILTPPEGSNWTPDLIDAYEQSWNALVAGNPQQQVRIRVTQPGFEYTPFVTPSLNAEIDRFWLNIRASAYGIPMEALNFTESSNRSTGEIQKDTLYEQALYPYVLVYTMLLTGVLQHDFEPSMHGDLMQVGFGGYEPPEDELSKAQTLSTYTGAGILGLSNAAKLAKLPEDPDAKQIGRVFFAKDGPVFLDDVADQDMRDATNEAKMAGLQLAANPPEPQPQEEEDQDEQGPPQNAKAQKGGSANSRGGDRKDATQPTKAGPHQSRTTGDYRVDLASTDYRNWRARAIEDVKAGRTQRRFNSTLIPEYVQAYLSFELERCLTADDVRELFKRVQDHQMMEVVL